MEAIYYFGKQVIIKNHAIRRAKERKISYPDRVRQVIYTGKIERFGKNGIKWIKRTKRGSIICIGEDIGEYIIIKTIERGN